MEKINYSRDRLAKIIARLEESINSIKQLKDNFNTFGQQVKSLSEETPQTTFIELSQKSNYLDSSLSSIVVETGPIFEELAPLFQDIDDLNTPYKLYNGGRETHGYFINEIVYHHRKTGISEGSLKELVRDEMAGLAKCLTEVLLVALFGNASKPNILSRRKTSILLPRINPLLAKGFAFRIDF